MNLCWKVYWDDVNEHYSFAVVKNPKISTYFLVNLTSFDTEIQFDAYTGCKFNKYEMHKILTPHIYNKIGRKFSILRLGDKSIPLDELQQRMKGKRQANFPEEFKQRVKLHVKNSLRGDLKREFYEYI